MHGRRPALQKREKNINKNRGRRERLVEELKTDMEEIGEGQERIKVWRDRIWTPETQTAEYEHIQAERLQCNQDEPDA